METRLIEAKRLQLNKTQGYFLVFYFSTLEI